jgi:tRNA-splicing ligase RtcB
MRELFVPPQKVPLLLWPERIDREALERLQVLARCEHLAGPIAVMPDVHSAGEVCVGTVLATQRAVLPTAIGEDLGCGMAVERLPLQASQFSREQFETIVAEVVQRVPTGKRSHGQPQQLPKNLLGHLSTGALAHQRDGIGARHFGTLGGGNHFIELQRDGSDGVWVTVHCGSRGIGAAIAAHHAKAAQAQSGVRKLPALRVETDEFNAFWSDLEWALSFAAENRRRIHDCVRTVLMDVCGQPMEASERFDVPHNIIRRELHGGAELLIHRKGAMPAPTGGRGIVPGSMGTASYIVEGLGCERSYATCSHGAGRRMSRHEARQKISIAQLRRELGQVVYPHDERLEREMVEEAPSAYKPLKVVMHEQEDLIQPVIRLEPIAVIKGG